MGYINVKIDDEIEKKVRMKIAKQGGKKGDLAKAAEDALKLWLEQKEKA
jgi:hypothetical protein